MQNDFMKNILYILTNSAKKHNESYDEIIGFITHLEETFNVFQSLPNNIQKELKHIFGGYLAGYCSTKLSTEIN